MPTGTISDFRMASTGLSVREACRRLNVSENTLRAMIADGRLPYRRIIGRSGTRGRIVIREADVDDLLAPPAAGRRGLA